MELIDKQKAKQALVDLPPELDALTVQKAIQAIGFVKAESEYSAFVGVRSGKQILSKLLRKMDAKNFVDDVKKEESKE